MVLPDPLSVDSSNMCRLLKDSVFLLFVSTCKFVVVFPAPVGCFITVVVVVVVVVDSTSFTFRDLNCQAGG